MIEIIICSLILLLIAFGAGMIYGQCTIWRSLRKKGHVAIDEWYYTAVKLKEEEYKQWD